MNRVFEIRSLTGIRGIAALYVVLLHYFSPIPLSTPVLRFFAHGYLAVDLFFPLSGFVMALNYSGEVVTRISPKRYTLFITRRFARIYPLYVVSLLAACLLVSRGLAYPTFAPSFWGIFWSNLFLIQVWGHWASMDPPAWSISTEWCAYLIFPLLQMIVSRSQRTAWISLAFAALVLTGLTVHGMQAAMWPKLLDHTTGVSALVRCVTEFIMGVAVNRAGKTGAGHAFLYRPRVLYPLSLAILILLCLPGTDLIVALLFPWLILSLSAEGTDLSRLLGSGPVNYLGQISFSLYLVHPLFGFVIDRVTLYLSKSGYGDAHLLAVAAIFPLLFACAAASHSLIEKPGRRFLRNVLEHSVSRPAPLEA